MEKLEIVGSAGRKTESENTGISSN